MSVNAAQLAVIPRGDPAGDELEADALCRLGADDLLELLAAGGVSVTLEQLEPADAREAVRAAAEAMATADAAKR